MKFATLLALTASVSANTVIQTDIFNIKNFMKIELMPNLLKASADTAAKIAAGEQIVQDGTKVQWGQCDDDKQAFTLDTDNTAADPDPLVKGSDVSLNLVGALSDDITLSNVHVHADWNGTPLYDEDHPEFKGKAFSDILQASLKWSVPAYAPNGNYKITLTGVDTDGSSKDFCVTADFSFN